MYRKQASIVLFFGVAIGLAQCSKHKGTDPGPVFENPDPALVAQGKDIFRFDSFGDEDFWSTVLHIDKAIAGSANGGFGGGVSPKSALAVGLKVDAEALPPDVVAGIRSGAIPLDDPATTLALLKLKAVVGINANFTDAGGLKSIGITCAFCHSTVDNSFAEGIGKRLDGWPNRDLNVGAIISLTDNAKPLTDLLHVDEGTLRSVLGAWGPGKFEAILFMDGKALKPDGTVAANLIPPAFGLNGVKLTTYTGWGDISYWNSFVGNLEMHGKGSFSDPRLNDPVKYPIAVENGFYNVVNSPDLISSKLPALKAYQHSLQAPKPAAGSFDAPMAKLGEGIFLDKGKCATCHQPPLFTETINNLHTGEEIGIDDFEANRSPTGKYRTTPLAGMVAKSKGGYYHDGRFATLNDVVDHYDNHFNLGLSVTEKQNLVEYLKSL
jgi:hypothetical protein